jgi:hypothetical protein
LESIVAQDNSYSLSEQSIEEAQYNVTGIIANKTGFEEEDIVGLSVRSIGETNK